MNPAPKRQESGQNPPPPTLAPFAVIGLTAISGGIFLWVWALMWAHWIKRTNSTSRVSTLAYANVVPGALLYINLPSLLLATRQNDATEIARLHIGIALWGSIALVSMIATGIAIFVAQRQIKASPQPTQ